MANEKILQLPSGAPAQPGDAIPIARPGTNFSLALSQLIPALPFLTVQAGGNTTGTTVNISHLARCYLAGGADITLSQIGNADYDFEVRWRRRILWRHSTGGNTAGKLVSPDPIWYSPAAITSHCASDRIRPGHCHDIGREMHSPAASLRAAMRSAARA